MLNPNHRQTLTTAARRYAEEHGITPAAAAEAIRSNPELLAIAANHLRTQGAGPALLADQLDDLALALVADKSLENVIPPSQFAIPGRQDPHNFGGAFTPPTSADAPPATQEGTAENADQHG